MGSNKPRKSRNDQVTADQLLAAGLSKHAATIPPIFIAGATVPSKDVITTLQSRVATALNVPPARATWLAAVQADRDERAKSEPLVSALKQSLLVFFAGQIDTLADFGLTGRKAPVVSPEVRVAAAAKAKATREARHTAGKNQKAKIKGTVTPTEPATATPATSPAAAPAAVTVVSASAPAPVVPK
jgi:hypothetical protein